MKRSIFGLAFLATMFAGCQTEPMDKPSITGSAAFEALTEVFVPQTKTSMTQDKQVVWSQNDRLAIFQGCTVADEFLVTDSSAGKTNGTFNIVSDNSEVNGSFSAGTEVPCNVAIYPYADGLSLSGASIDGGTLYEIEGVVLPAVQNYVAGSFGNGAFPMVAVTETMSDHTLRFKNVLGAMKLQLKGTQTVVSIMVEGKNGEKLSGAATVIAYANGMAPEITMIDSDNDSNSVVLDCGDGVQLSETAAVDFYIALPPMIFSDGFTVIVTDSENYIYEIKATTSNEVLRSSILVMPEVVLRERQRKYVDYVDEYGVNRGKGVCICDVVWAPVNCGYHEADFPYGKIYQWGRKYGQGYSGALYDFDRNCVIAEINDSTVPEILNGPVTLEEGQSESNSGYFYTGYDWLNAADDNLWNAGTESEPVKTENDPCPYGWRVPTYAETSSLMQNYVPSMTNEKGQGGYIFSGDNVYSSDVASIFLLAAGYRDEYAFAEARGFSGSYWTSKIYSETRAYYLDFYCENAFMNMVYRANAYSVRCVQE